MIYPGGPAGPADYGYMVTSFSIILGIALTTSGDLVKGIFFVLLGAAGLRAIYRAEKKKKELEQGTPRPSESSAPGVAKRRGPIVERKSWWRHFRT